MTEGHKLPEIKQFWTPLIGIAYSIVRYQAKT